jgi:hypothetical protein
MRPQGLDRRWIPDPPKYCWAKPEESVKNLSQRWAHAIFVLPCINHMFGSERIEQVPVIKSVVLATLESYPPKIAIRVIGEAPTGGWNPQGRLSEYIYFMPPVDGIYEFDFVTESPDPTAIVPQVTTEVSAFFVIDSIPPGFAGVKIYGSGNSMVAMLNDPTVSFTGSKLFSLGGGSSAGG